MTTTFKPDDCACRYPAKIFPTGSGHERECLAHQRWTANGKSWSAPEAEDPLRFTDEASELVLKLADHLEKRLIVFLGWIVGAALTLTLCWLLLRLIDVATRRYL